ncbi:MAG: hypothetical protein ABI672_17810 [Vicinamibacteria bacterium]
MRNRLPALTLTSLLVISCSSEPKMSAGEARPAASESRQAAATAAVAAGPKVEPSALVPPPPEVSAPKAEGRTQAASKAPPALGSGTPDKPAAAEVKAPPPPPVPTSPVAALPAPTPQATKPAVDDRPATATEPAHAPIAVDIGGLVEVAATKPGLTRIGATKCKLCHKIQFDSWAKTKHATRTPPLDCESCHGPGSEYKTLAIMKDSKKALAAGLVMPVRSFCSKCHTGTWTDDLLKRTHAHKTGV